MGVNDDRSVTVKLGLQVRDYLAGGTSVDAMNRRMQQSQRDLGSESDRTGSKLTKMGKDAEKGAASLGSALKFTGIGLAALGAGGGALRVIPPLLAAAGTGAAALPGVLAGAINSAVVLKVGLAGISDQLGKIYKAKDPFDRLTPNARNFLSTAERIKPAVLGLQASLQQRLTQGTGADLQLIADKTLPAVRGQLEQLATTWSNTFAEIALAVSDDQVTGAWNVALDGANEFFDGVNKRIRPTARSLAELAVESQPVANAIGGELLKMIDKFNAKVDQARQNGSLQQFFEAGAEAAGDMARIAGNVLDITGMVVSEVTKQNTAIGTAGDKLNAYVVSGRAAEDVAGIVHTLTVAWDGLAETMGPLGSVIRDAIADPGTAASIQQMFQVLAAGSQTISTVLQLFLSLNNATGGSLLTLIAFAVAVKKVQAVMELATTAAGKAATATEAYGGAVATAGSKLPAFVAGAGKAVTALVALNAAHSLIDDWTNDAVDMDGMAKSVEGFAKNGTVAGEMARDFGKDLGDLGVQFQTVKGAQEGGFAGFLASAEKAIPIAGDLAQALGADTFAGSEENFKGLDQALTDYVNKTGDVDGAGKVVQQILAKTGLGWADLAGMIPQATSAMNAQYLAQSQLETGTAGLAERQKLLNAPLRETITLGRSLSEVYDELNGKNASFAQATISAEAAIDDLNAGLAAKVTGSGKNKKTTGGLALTKDKAAFDTDQKRGREQLSLILETAAAAQKAAQAKLDDNGTVTQAGAVYDGYINRLRATLVAHGASKSLVESLIADYAKMPASLEQASGAANQLNGSLTKIPKGTKFTFDGESLVNAKGKTLELADGIKGIPLGKSFTWNGKSLVDGKGKAYDLKKAIDDVPGSKTAKVTVPGIDPITGKVQGLAEELQGLPDGIASIQVNNGSALAAIRQVRQSLANLGGAVLPVSANARGGLYKRAAAGGLVEAQVAPPGTLYQWAEPETQGEAFIPKKGNRERGRAIIDQAAEWYGGRFVAMARGGITIPAASGLVNVAPSTASAKTPASALDYAESYLQARDAVGALNQSLKDNGRALSTATAKGRENRSALFQVIRAAQDAAKTRFEETGSVRLANAAYDEHIKRLRATLVQQKINAATIRQLMALAQRPTYDTGQAAAPTNSLSNIAYVKAAMSAAAGIDDLRDKLSLNQVGVGIGTEGGRDNLSNIIGFFESAASSAQARYEQTHNVKSATSLYDGYVTQLRAVLTEAGYSAATIASLIKQFGRITLTSNARGGVYMARGGLGVAQQFPPGDRTLYGFAEQGTGGELFLPRNGDRSRGEDILRAGAGWYGGRYTPGGGGGGASHTTINNNLNVTPLTYNPSTTEILSYHRQMDLQSRVGLRR